MTKVTHTETHDNTIVCKGKLVLIPIKFVDIDFKDPSGIIAKDYTIPKKSENGMTVSHKPIIISETEVPMPNESERVYSSITKTVTTFPDPRFFSEGAYFKVLALPENFSPEILKDIVGGRLKDGDQVLMECEGIFHHKEEWDGEMGGDFIKNIKLNKDNHITILPGKNEEGWDEFFRILQDPDVSWGTKEAMVREKYNAPTRK